MENYFVFDGPDLLTYTNLPLTSEMREILIETVKSLWDEEALSPFTVNLGMSLNPDDGKLFMNTFLMNPQEGHAYIYQFNLTNKILASMPSDIYQNLYIALFNKKVAMDDIDILRKKSFVLGQVSPELLENDYIVEEVEGDFNVYANYAIERDNWFLPTAITIENIYRNNSIKLFFIEFVLLLILGFIIIYLMFIGLGYAYLNKVVFKRIQVLKTRIEDTMKVNYYETVEMAGDDTIVEIAQDVENIRKDLLGRMKFIDEMSYFDTVTGVGNVYLLEEKLRQLYLEEASANLEKHLIIFEIKNIKAQFEAYGVGKMNSLYANIIAILQSVFDRESVFRKSDYAFAVIYIDDKGEDVSMKLKKVKSQLKQLKLDPPIEPRFVLAQFPDHGENEKELIQNIDLAQQMLTDRDVVYYSQALKKKYLERLEIEVELKQALVNHEIYVVFQPVVSPLNNVIKGVETLIRWKPESGKKVYPDMFIPLAEQLDIIDELDKFVFDKAVSMLQLWSELYPYDFFVSINSSPKWFTNPEFLNYIKMILERYQVNPAQVCIEIIETCLIEDMEGANEILKQMKNLGLTIALDDFGKGYSSLNYLRKLKIDKLKIDKDFLSEMDLESGKYNLIDSIVSMAHQMNLEVVVEGVEEKDQSEYLKTLGVELIQGYYYSKPVDKRVISDILLNSGVVRQN